MDRSVIVELEKVAEDVQDRGKPNTKACEALTYDMIGRVEKEVNILDRHLQVFKTVIENEPIGIVKTSNELGYPHHKVRYSLRVLEEADLIKPTSRGATTTDRAKGFIDALDDRLDAQIDKLESIKIDDIKVSQ